MIDINITRSDTGKESPMDFVGGTVSGIHALAQRVLVVLLTQSTDMLRSDEGSTLITSIRSGAGDSDYARLLMLSAISRTKDVIRNNQEGSEEEQLKDILIQSTALEGDTISFTIVVYSQAGEYIDITSEVGAVI